MDTLHIKSINAIRMLSADAVQKAKSGHPGMPMGDADMAYVLWTKFLNHNPKNPYWPNRDRFILSAGHGSMLLYSLLHLTGYNITLDDIKKFRQLGSKTPGHPEYCLDSGVELSTGPLGFGFGVGVGMAMAEKYLAELFNKPDFNIVDHYIYGIVSDGDIMEGISYEASSIAGHLKLGKLIYLYSDNKTTIDGHTDLTFTEDVQRRFEAQNWHVVKVSGYKLDEIERALEEAKQEKDRPSMLIVRTHLGYGSPNKQDAADIHGAPLGEEELRLTKEHFAWPQKDFYLPQDVVKNYRQALIDGPEKEAKWNELMDKYQKKYPSEGALWQLLLTRQLSKKWKDMVPTFEVNSGNIATRSASGNFVNLVADFFPQLLGGSADLSPSNMTYIKKFPPFSPSATGRNIHYGIREHAMCAATIGMALSKMLIPYCGTYLVFSGYMVPAIRMAAMMRVHAIFILTHDSIGVGEDGPSHHPIEHLTTLRAMPNLTVIRPSDANETIKAWEYALENRDGPIAMVLTRQSVPIIDRKKYANHEMLLKGAYIIGDSGKKPELLMMASGSEVHLMLKAYESLSAEGIGVRAINVPSMELFERQPDDYKESVMPLKVEKRLAIEAGSSSSWYKYVGLKGKVISLDRFAVSAPAKVLFETYGFTVENVLNTAHKILKGQ